MTPQEKMQAIYNTGMSDNIAGRKVGYSGAYYMKMRKVGKTPAGNPFVPTVEAEKKLDALYEQRKDMPCRKVLAGWKKHKTIGTRDTRKCTSCGEIKPVGCFWTNRLNKDLIQHKCTLCYANERSKESIVNYLQHLRIIDD